MTKLESNQRIESIHQMLLDMARGIFTNRIPQSENEDELEKIIVLINMVAEEMQDAAFQMGYINFKTRLEYRQYSVILSKNLVIKNFTKEFASFVGIKGAQTEANLPILDFLTKASQKKLQHWVTNDDLQTSPLTLEFEAQNGLALAVFCYFKKFEKGEEYLLNLFVPCLSKNDLATHPDKNMEKKSLVRKSDAILIQQLYDYILAHLDEPLPSIKELARMHGTNESKLKEGFRYFFKTSIYQFYNEERLKRAFLMVQQTTIPLKTIAVMNGFSDYPNFSKSFKKQFGISPKEVVRKSIKT